MTSIPVDTLQGILRIAKPPQNTANSAKFPWIPSAALRSVVDSLATPAGTLKAFYGTSPKISHYSFSLSFMLYFLLSVLGGGKMKGEGVFYV